MQFLVITVVLSVIVLSPLAPKKSDVWTLVATLSILEVLGVAVMACVLRLAWRIVGGRSTIRSFFTLYAYLSSVALLLVLLTFLISEGTIRLFNPTLYETVKQAQAAHQPIPTQVAQSKAFIAGFIVLICGYVGAGVWGFVTWGAFRALNATTRFRSVLALFLCGLMSWPVALILIIVGRALAPSQ